MKHNHGELSLQKARDLAQRLSRDEYADVVVYSTGKGYDYCFVEEYDLPDEWMEDRFVNGFWHNA